MELHSHEIYKQPTFSVQIISVHADFWYHRVPAFVDLISLQTSLTLTETYRINTGIHRQSKSLTCVGRKSKPILVDRFGNCLALNQYSTGSVKHLGTYYEYYIT